MALPTSVFSPYQRIQVIYTRSVDGSLLSIFGPLADKVCGCWDPRLRSLLFGGELPTTTGSIESTSHFVPETSEFQRLLGLQSPVGVFEHKLPEESQIRGVIAMMPPAGFLDEEYRRTFEWLRDLVLQTSSINFCGTLPDENATALQLASDITEIFSRTLKNTSKRDLWTLGGGRNMFEKRVIFFTSRKIPVHFALPAFPCKSSSRDKAAGDFPDKGEEFALLSLYSFIQDIERIYTPGAKVIIVSDGHVFSDCIGVGDTVVDSYGEKLKEMKDRLLGKQSGKIVFVNLVELFDLPGPSVERLFENNAPVLPGTAHTIQGDRCRKLLHATCGSNSTELKKMQCTDPSSLALYRGFSRFMLEDLSNHPFMSRKSKSQRKKATCKIAFEMLKRNQAYSNLVEVLLPAHVRLSIHSHTNSGPKFAINLLRRWVGGTSLSLFEAKASREQEDAYLHIPTPWHNAMVKLHGQDRFVVVKAKVVRDAVRDGTVRARWVSGYGDNLGGYFLVWMNNSSAMV